MCASKSTPDDSTVSTAGVPCGVVRPRHRMADNYLVIWFDATIDPNNKDCKSTLTQLRNVVSDVNLFTTSTECIEFLNKMDFGKAFVISSGSLGRHLVNDIHKISRVDVICIFCSNKNYHEQWAKEWPKIRGVFTTIEPICECLKEVLHRCDHDSTPISYVSTRAIAATSGSSKEKNLDQLPPAYMYSVIFKNIILEIADDDKKQMDALVAYCTEKEASSVELNLFQSEYKNKSPVWWYTAETFLYRMLNKVLRSLNMEGMMKMGFFIRHLHVQLIKLHEEQSALFNKKLMVYRGQGLCPEDFQKLLNTKGGLLSFNSFLSTSTELYVAEGFVQEAMAKDKDIFGIIFLMTIDPAKISTSITPYAMIDAHSAIPTENEILFTMHTVFRVCEIKSKGEDNRLHEVQLTIVDDTDPELARLTSYINKEINGSGWYRMGKLMLKVGDFDQAEALYNDLLVKASSDVDRVHINHQIGWLKNEQGKYDEAAKYYEEALRIKLKTCPEDHCSLANIYNNIGVSYNSLGDYSKALVHYQKASRVKEKYLSPTNTDLAVSYNNTGLVYNNMGDYSKALEYYEKSNTILEKALPATHPLLAISYNRLGVVYYNLGDYKQALEFSEKDLKIKEKSLPEKHPDLAYPYIWFGRIHRSKRDSRKALENFTKCCTIRENALPEKHPQTAVTYSDIGDTYRLMGNYEEAVKFHKKALHIQEEVKCNPLECATTYMYLGETYREMKDYSTALKYFQKGLQIREEKLPQKHPALAEIYHNMSKLYLSTREYNLAMKNVQQAVDIAQERLPSNHPHLLEYRETFEKIRNEK